MPVAVTNGDAAGEWDGAIAIRPRSGGVHPEYVRGLPGIHVQDAGEDPEVTATVMRRAAELTTECPAASTITSKGGRATLTVSDLHVKPRARSADHRLPIPWPPQRTGGTR
ncbi:HIT family protein [Streptomyces goshikiensis]|uniref:HIT family protein n=1 Tax=Streptomyces goshikiensis TaxID=1942 RepID=UPI003324D162